MATHPRRQLVDTLTPLVPSTWRVIPAQRTFDSDNRTTLIVKQDGHDKPAGAVRAAVQVRFTLTLASRFIDPEKAEDDLDATVPQLLAILDSLHGITWSTTTKVAVDDTHLGYDITVQIATKKESL